MTYVFPAMTERFHAHPEGLSQRALGAYLGLAVGDALGATVEFMTPREITHQYGVHKDIIGGGWLKLKPGQVTDDTEMSLALGDAILYDRGFCAITIAEAFDAWLKSKPVDVGSTVRRAIVQFRTQGRTQMEENEYDAGNGAVMRALPVALATLGAPEDQVQKACIRQAHVTHNAALADKGLLTIVAMTQRALMNPNGAYPDMIAMAHGLKATSKKYDFTYKNQQNPSAYLPETIRAVFQSFHKTDNFESALIDVVNRGGDADTTGAILGFMAGALYGVKAIPERWLKALDTDVRRACEDQALALLSLSPVISDRPVRFIPD